MLAVCDGQGLIGREMFAIDGVKLPSNASKHRSGTRAEFTQRARETGSRPRTMLKRHRESDAAGSRPMWRRRPPRGSRASRGMRGSCASGAQRIRRIAAARPADCATAIAPTTRVRRGRPTKACSKATRALATIVTLIGETTTDAGLRIRSEIDDGHYPKVVRITDAQMAQLQLTPHAFHGEWNYTLHPRVRKRMSQSFNQKPLSGRNAKLSNTTPYTRVVGAGAGADVCARIEVWREQEADCGDGNALQAA